MPSLRRIARALTTQRQRRALSRSVFRVRTALSGPHAVLPLATRTLTSRLLTKRKPSLYQLEVHVADRCNLNCKGCGHFSPLAPGELPSFEEYERDLARLAALFENVGEIWLLGGEPLLHPRLLDFVTATRSTFPDARVGVVSNGLLLGRQGDEFWRSLAENRVHLRLSGYPVDVDYDELLETAAHNGVSADLTPWRDEFYKMPIVPAGDLDPKRMLAECRQHFDCPYLENGRIYHCARMPQSRHLTAAFGPALGDGLSAGIELARARDGWEVLHFLGHPNRWCRFCDAEDLEHFEWGRTERSPDEWLASRG